MCRPSVRPSGPQQWPSTETLDVDFRGHCLYLMFGMDKNLQLSKGGQFYMLCVKSAPCPSRGDAQEKLSVCISMVKK